MKEISQNKILLALVAILFLGILFLVPRYMLVQRELVNQNATVEKVNFNNRVLDFTSLFIEKVLKAKGEVSFEERLRLETMVRDLKDNEILSQWNKFVNSKTEAQAQEEVKNLLALLIRKIKS